MAWGDKDRKIRQLERELKTAQYNAQLYYDLWMGTQPETPQLPEVSPEYISGDIPPAVEGPVESTINIEDFIRDKLEPPIEPTDLPKVPQTTLEFDQEKTEDGIIVRAFLLLSPDDIFIIEDKGLDDEVLEEEPAFDEERTRLLKEAQAKEIDNTPDARARAILRAFHKQQLQDAKDWKLKRTIADYRAIERHFKRPLDATKWQNQLESTVMKRINTLLNHYRDKATQPVR